MARLVVFSLSQFHPILESDALSGEGFNCGTIVLESSRREVAEAYEALLEPAVPGDGSTALAEVR